MPQSYNIIKYLDIKIMTKNIIASLAIICLIFCISKADPSPPIWDDQFTQQFVVGDTKVLVYAGGKLWYDFKGNRQRLDLKSDHYDALCISVGQNTNTPCSHIHVNKTLYIYLPQNSKCCRCCTEAQGCTIDPPTWLKTAQFAGQSTILDQKFWKWTLGPQNYYETQDTLIPRRLQNGTYGLDFIMNSYAKGPMSELAFILPSYCQNDCPKTTKCGQFTSGMAKYSLKDTLLGAFRN